MAFQPQWKRCVWEWGLRQGTSSHYQKSYLHLGFSICQLNQHNLKYWDGNAVYMRSREPHILLRTNHPPVLSLSHVSYFAVKISSNWFARELDSKHWKSFPDTESFLLFRFVRSLLTLLRELLRVSRSRLSTRFTLTFLKGGPIGAKLWISSHQLYCLFPRCVLLVL